MRIGRDGSNDFEPNFQDFAQQLKRDILPPRALLHPELALNCQLRSASGRARGAAGVARSGAQQPAVLCARRAARRLRAEALCGLTAGPAQALSIQHTATSPLRR